MVWLGEPVSRSEVKLRFHKQLSEMPFEHREAVAQKALEVFFHNQYTGPIAVVNRSGIAVVFDPGSESGHVLPLAELKGLDADGKRAFAEWLASGENRPFVFNLVGGFNVE
jgi:hypothetical protein